MNRNGTSGTNPSAPAATPFALRLSGDFCVCEREELLSALEDPVCAFAEGPYVTCADGYGFAASTPPPERAWLAFTAKFPKARVELLSERAEGIRSVVYEDGKVFSVTSVREGAAYEERFRALHGVTPQEWRKPRAAPEPG